MDSNSSRPELIDWSWGTSLIPRAFGRAFSPPPPDPIWRWAEKTVWLESKEAAEAGPYRSSKTPWNRRLQEIGKRPVMHCYDFAAHKWVEMAVGEYSKMKSSQSGVTEAALNIVRYRATFRPCNVIYSIDTRETAAEISKRLQPSLEKIDADIFTGDDDDVGTYTMRLRGMNIWFQGSFSSGKFASKMAPLVINDEVEEHGVMKDNASTVKQSASRKKTADDGLQINICKPKKKNGPIHKAYLRGNQERLHIACPHCGVLQPLTFHSEEMETVFSAEMIDVRDEATGEVVARLPQPLPIGQSRKVTTGKIVFSHCKDLLNRWDEMRILNETYYECGSCKGAIEEWRKGALVEEAVWIPTSHGTPGIVSQHINDLYSSDRNSSWGRIVLEYLTAKREGRREMQGFWNDRLGLPWTDEAVSLSLADLRRNIASGTNGCPPYRRGTVPFFTYPQTRQAVILIGSDIGGNYGRWAAGVLTPNLEDVAIFDWGEELDPDAIATVALTALWPMAEFPDRKARASVTFIDGKYRKTEVYKAALRAPNGTIIPVTGIGGTAARVNRLWSYSQIPQYRANFKRLSFNDREAKDELYIDRLKKAKRRVWFPMDVEADPKFCEETTKEELLEDTDSKETKWKEKPGANHYGDCVKNITTGIAFLTRKQRGEQEVDDGAGE